jgi:hypothetical protein
LFQIVYVVISGDREIAANGVGASMSGLVLALKIRVPW